MKKLLIVMSFVFVASFMSCKEESKDKNKDIGEIEVVSPEEMETLLELDDVQLVDVRTPEEYSEGYIAKSQNIDFRSPTFDEDINELDRDKPVLLYCKSGRRSAQCAQKLIDAGFVKIYDLNGGISKWEHEGLEIKTKS